MFAQTPGSVSTGNTKSGNVSAAGRRFATEAAEGGMAEVQLGQRAASKATNPDVKALRSG
jgi:hypothetical protein